MHGAHKRISERDEAFMPGDASGSDAWGMIDVHEGIEMESALKRPEGTHFRYGE